jgi:hypothetical protein
MQDSYLSRPFFRVCFNRTAFYCSVCPVLCGWMRQNCKTNLIRCQKCCKDQNWFCCVISRKTVHMLFTMTHHDRKDLNGSNKTQVMCAFWYLERKALVSPRDLHKSKFVKWKNHKNLHFSPLFNNMMMSKSVTKFSAIKPAHFLTTYRIINFKFSPFSVCDSRNHDSWSKRFLHKMCLWLLNDCLLTFITDLRYVRVRIPKLYFSWLVESKSNKRIPFTHFDTTRSLLTSPPFQKCILNPHDNVRNNVEVR